ncbi:MAG: O-antigen ligase family protein [bacterium]|nr:O-antigen ligase family protein [bacterium]
MLPRNVSLFYQSSLITLPWVGVGVVHYFFGRDVGGGLQVSWLLLAIATLVSFAKFRHSGPTGFQFSPLVKVLLFGSLLGVLVSALGMMIAPSLEPMGSAWARLLKQLLQLLIMLVFVLWPALWTHGVFRWQRTLDLLFLGLGFQLVYSFFQFTNYYFGLGWFGSLEVFFTSNPSILSGSEQLYLNNVMQDIPRLRGTMCEPLYLGNYLLMIWPFLLVWDKPRSSRLTIGVFMAALLILTWSRGAWLALLVQMFFWVILKLVINSRRRFGDRILFGPTLKVVFRSVLILMLGLVVVNLVSRDALSGRLLASFNNQDWSNLTRLYSMKAAWDAFMQSPVVGVGWGQYAFHFPLLVDSMGLQSQFSWPVVNNFYLKILCETGLVGFAVFIAFFLLLWVKVWRSVFRAPSGIKTTMVLPASLSVVGVWAQMMTFSQYNLPHIWVGLGLLLAAISQSDKNLPDREGCNK